MRASEIRNESHQAAAATPLRAIIAARKSTKVDDADHGIGLDTQDEKSRAFAERLDIEVVAVATDTITGRTAPIDRPDLGALLAEPWMFDAVIAYRADRLSRGEDTDWSRIETWAADNHKTLIIVDSADGIRYPARNDSDRWQWMSQKTQAGKEWNDIRERSIRAQCRIMRDGGWVGRKPWGFTIEGHKYGKTIAVDETLRATIEAVFDMAIKGQSLRAIARWLESQGIPTERGNEAWSDVAARRVLTNPVYTGTTERTCAECGQSHPFTVPAIVDAATQARATAALVTRQRGIVKAGGRPSANPAAFVPACGNCSDFDADEPRIVRMYRAGTNGVSYYCKRRTQAGVHTGCGQTVNLAAVDATANEWLSMLQADEVARTVTYPAAVLENKLALANREYESASKARDRSAMMKALDVVEAIEDKLKGTPRERVELTATGRTLGQAWTETPATERKAWLRKQRLEVVIRDGVTSVLGWS